MSDDAILANWDDIPFQLLEPGINAMMGVYLQRDAAAALIFAQHGVDALREYVARQMKTKWDTERLA